MVNQSHKEKSQITSFGEKSLNPVESSKIINKLYSERNELIIPSSKNLLMKIIYTCLPREGDSNNEQGVVILHSIDQILCHKSIKTKSKQNGKNKENFETIGITINNAGQIIKELIHDSKDKNEFKKQIEIEFGFEVAKKFFDNLAERNTVMTEDLTKETNILVQIQNHEEKIEKKESEYNKLRVEISYMENLMKEENLEKMQKEIEKRLNKNINSKKKKLAEIEEKYGSTGSVSKQIKEKRKTLPEQIKKHENALKNLEKIHDKKNKLKGKKNELSELEKEIKKMKDSKDFKKLKTELKYIQKKLTAKYNIKGEFDDLYDDEDLKSISIIISNYHKKEKGQAYFEDPLHSNDFIAESLKNFTNLSENGIRKTIDSFSHINFPCGNIYSKGREMGVMTKEDIVIKPTKESLQHLYNLIGAHGNVIHQAYYNEWFRTIYLFVQITATIQDIKPKKTVKKGGRTYQMIKKSNKQEKTNKRVYLSLGYRGDNAVAFSPAELSRMNKPKMFEKIRGLRFNYYQRLFRRIYEKDNGKTLKQIFNLVTFDNHVEKNMPECDIEGRGIRLDKKTQNKIYDDKKDEYINSFEDAQISHEIMKIVLEFGKNEFTEKEIIDYVISKSGENKEKVVEFLEKFKYCFWFNFTITEKWSKVMEEGKKNPKKVRVPLLLQTCSIQPCGENKMKLYIRENPLIYESGNKYHIAPSFNQEKITKEFSNIKSLNSNGQKAEKKAQEVKNFIQKEESKIMNNQLQNLIIKKSFNNYRNDNPKLMAKDEKDVLKILKLVNGNLNLLTYNEQNSLLPFLKNIRNQKVKKINQNKKKHIKKINHKKNKNWETEKKRKGEKIWANNENEEMNWNYKFWKKN